VRLVKLIDEERIVLQVIYLSYNKSQEIKYFNKVVEYKAPNKVNQQKEESKEKRANIPTKE